MKVKRLVKYALFGTLLTTGFFFAEKASALETSIRPVTTTQSNSNPYNESKKQDPKSSVFVNTFLNGYFLKLNLNKNSYITTNSPGLKDYFPSMQYNRVALNGELSRNLLKAKDRERRFINIGGHSSQRHYFTDFIYSTNGKFNRYLTYLTGGFRSKLGKDLELELGSGARFSNYGSDNDRRKIVGSLKLDYKKSRKDCTIKATGKLLVSTQYSNAGCEFVDCLEANVSFSPNVGDRVKPVITGSYKEDFRGNEYYNLGVGVNF